MRRYPAKITGRAHAKRGSKFYCICKFFINWLGHNNHFKSFVKFMRGFDWMFQSGQLYEIILSMHGMSER